MRLILSFFRWTYQLDLLPRRDTDSLFCGRWIFLHLPEIQWRRRSPPFMATGRCRPHTSPLVYTFSLYRLIIRNVFQFPTLHNPLVAFSLSFSPCDKTLPRLITFIIRLGLFYARLPCSCISLQRTKREKKFPAWWRKSAVDRRTHQRHHFVLLFNSDFFYLSRNFIIVSTKYKVLCSILIFNYLYNSYM